MSNKKNLFGWASISENGTINGKKGNQTLREVRTGYYYNFGQDVVIRFKNVVKGRKMAEITKYCCNKTFLGYGQSDRYDFFRFCSSLDWKWKDVKEAIDNGTAPKCNTDCSMFAVTCINLVYGKEKISADTTTRNLLYKTVTLNKTNFKSLTVKQAEKKFHKGDMPLKAGKHVIINV